ncbi:conserved hypothetical protein [Streptomyces sp. e14]|uniref:DUF5954 family protein n=1 Tax=Streptomyces sp. e14 TaxID=645465 RepID=UPI0001D05C9F|nr:DUF5954 family protein [Streptomyces sp. e14]EFF93770.1 conserved hypothetical protein [Streptomyces sp. e14]
MTDDWQRQLHALHEELIRRDDPAAWVKEADAVDASLRYPHLALRGPVFGVAVQDPAAGPGWRVLKPVVDGMPQVARDGMHSHLWFTAKDGTDDRAVRRELLAAVALLEREPANEVTACGVRYRVVRGEEFMRCALDGAPEPPRPTDPEPADRTWERRQRAEPSPDADFVLDPDRVAGPMAYALKQGLREFSYRGGRCPDDIRADSERALTTHPEVVLLPVAFGLVERRGEGWMPRGGLHAAPHQARRMFYDGMAEIWAMLHDYDDEQKARYARAAEEYRALQRADEFTVDGRAFRICRVERMVRMGPDGPEPARPSDVDEYGPTKMHPTMDEDGTITH